MRNTFNECPIRDEYKPKIKLQEAFDFDSVNKQNKSINGKDVLLSYLKQHINDKDLTYDDYNILISYTGFYKVYDNLELRDLIEYIIKNFGNDCNLNWIDTSNVTNMSGIFEKTKFNGNISQWDVSNVIDMSYMFSDSTFNKDISQWDVSKVINMEYMFSYSVFNQDISNWNVGNVKNMCSMFWGSLFNNDISQWDVSNVIDMSWMFENSKFNNDISQWDVSNVKTRDVFQKCPIRDEYKPNIK